MAGNRGSCWLPVKSPHVSALLPHLRLVLAVNGDDDSWGLEGQSEDDFHMPISRTPIWQHVPVSAGPNPKNSKRGQADGSLLWELPSDLYGQILYTNNHILFPSTKSLRFLFILFVGQNIFLLWRIYNYSLHPMKSAILIFFEQISGAVKRLSYPYLFAICQFWHANQI
jgi:hypothetical protein